MTKNHVSNRQPLVSIITPSFNSGKFIEECIQSVSNQDYPYVEHIIQDGGSKDETINILTKYSNSNIKNKIKWESRRDNGPTDAYNKALQRSRGDIILFLGADDALMPGAISWAVKNMFRHKDAAVIYGDEYITDEKSRTITTFVPKSFNFVSLLCLELVPPAEASFIRRYAFEKVGFHLDESLKNAPDYELWVRIGLKYPIVHVKGFVTKYRWHSRSRSRDANLIKSFVKEKKQVMNKLFHSSSTSKKIRNLKKRAHIGLYFWAATMKISYGEKYGAIWYLTKALILNPRKEIYDYYISFWKQAVKDQERIKKLQLQN